MIDLNPSYLAIVERILAEHVPECEVRAFGSRASWTAKDYSDLDLAIVGDGPLDWRTLALLKEAFEESDLPMRVDVLDWHDIAESFQCVIERGYVVLQAGDNTIEKLSNGWPLVALGECATINDDTYAPHESWPFINYLDTGSITDNRTSEIQHLVIGEDTIPSRARRKLRHGDIVYSTVRPNQRHFGLIQNVPENFLASTGFAVIRGIPDVAHTGFLYWFLAQNEIVEYLHAIAEHSTSAYPSIRPSDLATLTVPLPPLSEQRAVAHILGTLDDKIELNRRMNETLEEMARTLFRSWFVDFEPVRAKMEGRWRSGESLPGLSADLYDLFPDRLVSSELGDIPEGWEVKPLGEVIAIYDSKRVPLNNTQRAERRGVYPYYGATGVMDYVDDFLFDGVYVLTGEDGSVADDEGYPVVQYVWGKFWANNHAHVLKGTAGISEEYLYLLLQQTNITPFVTGAVQPKLNQMNLKSIPFVLPGQMLCRALDALVQPIYGKIRDSTDESAMLRAQRDALLPKLVSGEFRTQ